jgi:mRNA interferase MazF
VSAALSRGDIILVPFPFTDLTSRKVRPALVLNVSGEDILVAFISSVAPSSPTPADFTLSPSHPDFSKTGLRSASTFKLFKLICLDRSLALRKLGFVSPELQREFDLRLSKAVGLK